MILCCQMSGFLKLFNALHQGLLFIAGLLHLGFEFCDVLFFGVCLLPERFQLPVEIFELEVETCIFSVLVYMILCCQLGGFLKFLDALLKLKFFVFFFLKLC